MSGDSDRVVLDEVPSLAALYARALRPGGGTGSTTLPTTTVVREAVTVDRAAVASYARVCGYRLRDALPPTYLHVLAFPLSIHLMAGDEFPFPLLGMVHLHQRITVHHPLTPDDRVDLAVRVGDLRAHPKGRQFDVHATATTTTGVVWTGRSTYLHRTAGGAGDGVVPEPRPTDEVDVATLPLTARWRVPADIGRAYAAVSGDRNPIHLSAITARPLGFDRAIAHGMWTVARALAGLDARLPDRSTTDATFRAPLLLPSVVELATARRGRGEGWAIGVRSRGGRSHLAAVVSALD